MIAFTSPVSADTYTENFDDDSYDLSVQLGQGAFWCNSYSNQYGTEGSSLCLFNTSSPTELEFPFPVQGFQFIAGAKNGTTYLTVSYTDDSTEEHPIDGTCCEATVSFVANEGMAIERISIPADSDLWLFDSLSWFGELPTPTTTSSVEPSTTVQSTTTVLETTTTSSTSTTSSTVFVEVLPPPPPDTTTTEVSTTTSSVPETTTTVPVVSTTASTTTVPSTTTTEPVATTAVESPQTSVEAPISVETAPPVGDTAPINQPPINASEEEKEEFESQVNIYSGDYDDYVPAGSTVTVAQRRTIVAVTAVAIMFAPPPSNIRRRK